MRGQTYIPPQPAARGALIVSLANTGPRAVTIESVGLIGDGVLGYPSALSDQAGPVTYAPLTGSFPQVTSSSPRFAGATLRPGENVLIRIPFLTPNCWLPGRAIINSFWVTTRFLWWTHTFAVSWTPPGDQYGGAIMSQIPDLARAATAPCRH